MLPYRVRLRLVRRTAQLRLGAGWPSVFYPYRPILEPYFLLTGIISQFFQLVNYSERYNRIEFDQMERQNTFFERQPLFAVRCVTVLYCVPWVSPGLGPASDRPVLSYAPA